MAAAVAILLWRLFSIWPNGLEDAAGSKEIFLNAFFNGFTLIFGLMRNVHLAHGSLYLLGGYVGYEFATLTGYWLLTFIVVAALGVLMQIFVFRRIEGQELRQPRRF